MARKSKATLEQEAIATLTKSWELKSFGNTLDQQSYIDCYKVGIEKDLAVFTISGSAQVPKEFKPYINGKFTSHVSVPVGYDINDPESEENKMRMDHAIMIRDHILEKDLAKMEELLIEAYESVKE